MIHILSTKQINIQELEPLLLERNVLMINPSLVEQTTGVIKQWIAIQLAKHYEKDPKKMLEAKKHWFHFIANSTLSVHECVLTTTDQPNLI